VVEHHPGKFVVQRNLAEISSALETPAGAQVVDQNAAHTSRREREKMLPVLPGDPLLLEQTQVGFMNQGSRLKGGITSTAHVKAAGDSPKPRIDQRDQVVESFRIALAPASQQICYVPAQSSPRVSDALRHSRRDYFVPLKPAT